MSKISRKTTMALAIAGALAFTMPAFAATVQNGAPSPTVAAYSTNVANVSIASATTALKLNKLYLNTDASGKMLGLASNFTVTIQLSDGAKFDASTVPAVALGTGLGAGWNAPGSFSGGAGSSTLAFTVSGIGGGAGAAPIISGEILDVSGLAVTNVAGLATAGGTVSGTITIRNAVLGSVIQTVPFTVATSVNPLTYTITGGDTTSRIDLAPVAPSAARTVFSSTGVFGGAVAPTFDAGLLKAGIATGAVDNTGTAFAWTNTDGYSLKITGKFAAFAGAGGAVLATLNAGSCAGAALAPTTATLSADGTTITFADTANANLIAAGAELCFKPATGAAAKPIDPTAISTVLTLNRGTAKSTGSATAVPMQLNGAVAKVFTFNPGSNSNQQSLLRITNTGTLDGLVTISGTDDKGVAAPGGTVSFMLKKGTSVQLTAQDLENGGTTNGGTVLTGAMGDGTGKWTLRVDGQVSSMEVTNLSRGASSGMFLNLGTPVSGDSK